MSLTKCNSLIQGKILYMIHIPQVFVLSCTIWPFVGNIHLPLLFGLSYIWYIYQSCLAYATWHDTSTTSVCHTLHSIYLPQLLSLSYTYLGFSIVERGRGEWGGLAVLLFFWTWPNIVWHFKIVKIFHFMSFFFFFFKKKSPYFVVTKENMLFCLIGY